MNITTNYKTRAKKVRKYLYIIAIVVILSAVGVDLASPTVTVIAEERDNVSKLVDNLEEKVRQLEDAKKTLARAEMVMKEAEALHDQAIDEYNTSVSSLNLYQGIK